MGRKKARFEKPLSVSFPFLRYLRYLLLGGFVCSRKNQAADSVGHLEFVEIDQQPDWDIEKLHVAQELGFVQWEQSLDCFHLYQHAIFDQHIEA